MWEKFDSEGQKAWGVLVFESSVLCVHVCTTTRYLSVFCLWPLQIFIQHKKLEAEVLYGEERSRKMQPSSLEVTLVRDSQED